MEVSCLERDRKWEDFMDRLRYWQLPKIRDKREIMNRFFLFPINVNIYQGTFFSPWPLYLFF